MKLGRINGSLLTASAVLSLGLLQGCDGSTDTGDGGSNDSVASFTVQLNNDATTSMSSPGAMAITTSFEVKLGGVDLIAECAGNNPPGTCLEEGLAPDPDIWVNAGCNDDIAQCTADNTEFFELIDPAAANAELNSQGRSIETGTFTSVRIYILNNDNDDTVRCGGAVDTVRPNVPIQVPLTSPLVVEAGDTVTVTLNYDPSALDCDIDTTVTDMFADMTATVTIE